MKKCTLFETLNPVSQLKIDKSTGLMELAGTFGVCGIINNNKRVYDTSNYSKMVTEMKSRISQDGGIAGELEHPSTMNISLDNISHKITEINIDEDGVVTGKIQLLNTPKGKIAQAIIEGGLPLYVSSRATGQIDENGHVTLDHLYTYDLVGTPGFSQARMYLNESQVCESLSDNLTIVIEDDEDNKDNNELSASDIRKLITDIQVQIKELSDKVDSLNAQVNVMSDDIEEVSEKATQAAQDWIVNEYSPTLEDWIVNEYSPTLEDWIVNEYSPTVQDWITEKYSRCIQNWIINEYSPEIRRWVTEEFGATVHDTFSKEISEALEASKTDKLETISETLALLENISSKPTYPGNVNQKQVLNESEPIFIAQMPDQYRPKYNMANEALKNKIMNRAKLYDFVGEGAVERFWETQKWDEPEQVNENLTVVENLKEREMRSFFRRNK